MIEYLESRMARCKERGLLCTSFSKWYADMSRNPLHRGQGSFLA
jgi:hypothetical protein